MKYTQWRQNPTRFLAMTGLEIDLFDQFLPYFHQAHQDYFARFHLDGKPRSPFRLPVIYQNSPLPTTADRLAFVLCFQKLNPLQEDHADRFSMTQKQANQFIHCLTLVLQNALKRAQLMPATTLAELEKRLLTLSTTTPLDLFHDATEREIPRPQDADRQKEVYSGKQKKHTLKNALLTEACCLVLFVSLSVAGHCHDKTLADQVYGPLLSSVKVPIRLWQDTGYQGFKPDGVTIMQPTKKPRGRDLTGAQKEANQAISSVRVRVEHAIGSIKRYRVVKDECRLRKNEYVEKIFAICAGLHNLRVVKTPFNYPEIKLT